MPSASKTLFTIAPTSCHNPPQPPVQGLVLQNTFSKRCSLPDSEALSRLNTWKVGTVPAHPYGYGRDGATRKGVRTSCYVF